MNECISNFKAIINSHTHEEFITDTPIKQKINDILYDIIIICFSDFKILEEGKI